MQAMMDELHTDTLPRKRVSDEEVDGGEATSTREEETENVSAETFLPEPEVTAPQRRADALLHLAGHYLAGGGEGHTPLNVPGKLRRFLASI